MRKREREKENDWSMNKSHIWDNLNSNLRLITTFTLRDCSTVTFVPTFTFTLSLPIHNRSRWQAIMKTFLLNNPTQADSQSMRGLLHMSFLEAHEFLRGESSWIFTHFLANSDSKCKNFWRIGWLLITFVINPRQIFKKTSHPSTFPCILVWSYRQARPRLHCRESSICRFSDSRRVYVCRNV